MKNSRRSAAASDAVAADLPFEDALAELDALLQKMEDGRLSLDESLAAYQRGALLLRHCQSQLDAADHRLRILEDDALKPFVPDVGGPA